MIQAGWKEKPTARVHPKGSFVGCECPLLQLTRRESPPLNWLLGVYS